MKNLSMNEADLKAFEKECLDTIHHGCAKKVIGYLARFIKVPPSEDRGNSNEVKNEEKEQKGK